MFTAAQKQKIRDKSWRFTSGKLYRIIDKDGNLIPYIRNRAQVAFRADPHPRKIVLKSRQLGFTTDGVNDQFDDTLFTKHFRGLFVAHLKGEAENILNNKLGVLWDNFPLKDLYKLANKNRGEFRVNFGRDKEGKESESFLRVASSGRSGTYDYVHITELSKMEKEERAKATELVRGTIPAVPFNGKVTIESTAEDDWGLFYEMFWEAWDRKSAPLPTEFKAFFYNWTYDDKEIAKYPIINLAGRNQAAWFLERQARFKWTQRETSYYYQKWLELNRDFEALLQQYPTTPEEAFRSSGAKFFSPQFLDLQVTRDPIVVGDWKFYSKRRTDHVYVMGVDPSGGVGKDNAVIIVIDLTTGEIAAEYVSRFTSPKELAYEAVAKATLYNQCLLGVESNNHGLATLYQVQALNYPNIYQDTTYDKETNEEKKTLGFRTDLRTKPLILHALKDAINTFALRTPSATVLRELRSYQREQLDKMQFDEELGHFDRVMALAIAWHMRLQAPTSGKITQSNYA